MDAAGLVASTYLTTNGKLPTFVSGSAKWSKILAIANNKIDVWASEEDANWNSLYDPAFSIGTVTATNTFDLDDSIHTVSDTPDDTIDIANLDGTTSKYQTVSANKLKTYPDSVGKYCSQVGRTLRFNKTFSATDKEFGGTINVPSYLYPDHLVNNSDTVPVDDPQWLVLATAAEYVRNDLLKQNQYPNLINEANDRMEAMKLVNDEQVESVSRPWNAAGSTW